MQARYTCVIGRDDLGLVGQRGKFEQPDAVRKEDNSSVTIPIESGFSYHPNLLRNEASRIEERIDLSISLSCPI